MSASVLVTNRISLYWDLVYFGLVASSSALRFALLASLIGLYFFSTPDVCCCFSPQVVLMQTILSFLDLAAFSS